MTAQPLEAVPEQRPESVTVPLGLYEQITDVLLRLPAGQVFGLLQQLQDQAVPNYPVPAERPDPGTVTE